MSDKALAAAIWPNLQGSSTIGVKKSVVCRSRPPPNGMNPASSRVSIPLRKPSAGPGASPLSTYSRSPGANLEAQPALEEYFVSLMRVRSSIAAEYNLLTRRLKRDALCKDVAGCRSRVLRQRAVKLKYPLSEASVEIMPTPAPANRGPRPPSTTDRPSPKPRP